MMIEKVMAMIKKNRRNIVCVFIAVVIAICILAIPRGHEETVSINLNEMQSITKICEWSTLKSFYHNVAICEIMPDGVEKVINDILLWPFGVYTKIGYKQIWIEYSGIVEVGIDANEIRISAPDADGVVEIYVPDARPLSVYADEDSLTEPLTEEGWFTSVTGKEKMETFSTAQNAMRHEAENDQSLLMKAKDNAKVLLEKYIIGLGKEMGVNYSVKWADAPF